MTQTSKAVDLAHNFKLYRKKNATSVVEQASTCLEAKETLSLAEYRIFCQLIGEQPKSSNLKKLHCIGKKRSRFESVMESIPPNLYSIYLLSQIDNSRFEELIRSNRIQPEMTIKDIKSLSETVSSQVAPVHSTVKVTLELFDQSLADEFKFELSNFHTKIASMCVKSKDLDLLLEPRYPSVSDSEVEEERLLAA
jgi:hypothetical protein